MLYRQVDSLGLPEVFFFSHLFFNSSTANMWTCNPIRFIGPRTSWWSVAVSIVFYLLITHAGDLSGLIVSWWWSPCQQFWISCRESISVKDWSKSISVCLSVYCSIGVFQKHKYQSAVLNNNDWCHKVWIKCHRNDYFMNNGPFWELTKVVASAIQHLTITLNVSM